MVNAPDPRSIKHVSTGRGGAANFRKATNLAKQQHASAQQQQSLSQSTTAQGETDCELTRIATKASLGARFSMGRGGAGNMLPSGEAPLPATAAPVVSRAKTVVAVGRGGAGNFKDAKSGRSVSTSSSSGRPKVSNDTFPNQLEPEVAHTDRPTWASNVPRIDAGLYESAIDDEDEDVQAVHGTALSRRRSTNGSVHSAPPSTSFFGKMRRRFSSFGSALD